MTIWLWIGFIVFVLAMLALDLGVFNREARVIRTGEALRWTCICVLLALGFNAFVYFAYQYHWFEIGAEVGHTVGGKQAAMDFFTGYVIEQSLSLDNIFVIALIFSYFRVPSIHQHRVLFWGILGALVMRAGMIFAGVALIERFHWMVYIFGALLLMTAAKILMAEDKPVDYRRNILVRLAGRFYPVSDQFDGEKFFSRVNGKQTMTPLFLALIIVESTDVIFAVDSIPAILAITTDPFIVFTSNVFAILCLRSMYFALAGMMDRFHYLETSLVFILAYVGIKMLVSPYLESRHVDIPTWLSLLVITAILGVGIVASLLKPKQARSSAENQ